MKRLVPVTVATLLVVPAAAQAQTAPAQTAPAQSAPAQGAAPAASATPTVGATVYDTSGTAVGTVDSIAGDVAVISTGTNKVPVPMTSIGAGTKGPTMAMTRAQLDAAYAQAAGQAQQQLQAQLVPGTQVRSRNGTAVVGTIKAADASFVTLTASNGKEVKLPANGFSMGPNGLIVGLTAEEFQRAVGGADAAAGDTTTPASTQEQ